MSIASRITAMQEHLRDDYDVLTLAGADLTNVDKNILNLKPTWKERLLYFMNNGTQQVWDNWDKVNGTGTTLTLNNTEEAPMSLVYKGNTSQNGTPTPDNPVPIQVVSGDNSIEVRANSNLQSAEQLYQRMYAYAPTYVSKTTDGNINVISFNNSHFRNDVEPPFTIYNNWKENTQYTVRGLFRNSESGSGSLFFRIIYTDNTVSIISVNSTSYTELRIVSAVGKTIKSLGFSFGQVKNYYLDMSSWYIGEGDITEYPKYTGESYPISLGDIELCKIGTYQDKIDKSSGKNLFDGEIENGYINYQTGENVNGDNYRRSKNFIKVNPSTTYYLNMGNAPTGAWCGTIQYDKNKNFLEYKAWSKDTTLTTRNDTEYIRFYLNATSYDKICINVNDTNFNGEYEPYGTGWYLKKEIGKVVLNGSETWSFGADNNTTTYIINSNISNLKKSTNIVSNYFGESGNSYIQTTTTDNRIILGMENSIVGITSGDTNPAKRTKIQTWLSSNNTTVYYVLATPTYTLIEDSTLIEELESMKKSYENQTNISQVNNDMPFILDITALSKE